MSSHWRSSRWSSAREREAKEKAAAESRQQGRKSGSRTPEAEPEPVADAPDLSSLISSSRKRQRKWPYPEASTTPEGTTPEEPAAEAPVRASRRRRTSSGNSIPAATPPVASGGSARRGSGGSGGAGGGGGPALPNLPDEPEDGRRTPPNSISNRALILGLGLFLLIGAIAIYSSGILPGTGSNPTPTPPTQVVATESHELVNPPADSSDEGNADGIQIPETTEEPQQLATRDEIVCIDAGHGGWDPGRVRQGDDRAPYLEESDLNLGMAWMLKENLEAKGFTVVMTRDSAAPVNIFNEDVNGDGQVMQDIQSGDQAGDRDELQARILACNAGNADILISMHINGYDDDTARGYEVWFTPAPVRPFGNQSKDLAYYVFNAMTTKFDEIGFVTNPRGVFDDTDSDAPLHEGRVEEHYVMLGPAINATDFSIVPSAMPGIICEAGFITNDADAAFMADPANQREIVDAYANGIVQYFDQYPGHFQR